MGLVGLGYVDRPKRGATYANAMSEVWFCTSGIACNRCVEIELYQITRALVLSCLIRATGWANAPRWGGRLRCWLAAPLPLPQQWTCSAVQIVTRVPLSLYLGPRLVNVVSLAYKILTANHVLIMQPKGRTTDECSIRVPQMSGRQF